jgi:hypothetical protein
VSRGLLASLCLVVTLVAATACGDDTVPTEPAAPDVQLDADARAYADAVTAAIEQEVLPLDDTETRCFAERLVDAVGVSGFEASDVTPDDLADEGLDALPALDEAQVGTVAGSFQACEIDLYEYLAGSAGDGAADEQTVACFRDSIGAGTLARILALSFGSTDLSEQTQQPLVDAYIACAHLITE